MAFLDGFLGAVTKATESMKENMDRAREENERKKAEREAYEKEMSQKTYEYSQKIVQDIKEFCDGSNGGIYANVSKEELLAFTKEFYEKLLLPGSKTSQSCVSMHPYIDDKKVKEFCRIFNGYNESESPLLSIKDKNGQQLVLTTSKFYFKLKLPENSAYFYNGVVDCKDIDIFELQEKKTNTYVFKCDTYELVEIELKNTYKQDFISLNDYFKRIKNKEFEISDVMIDSLIKQKIGDKIYSDVRKYMTYGDDELLLYYAGGLDSLLAIDYVACTNKQIIIVDREAFGATANIKQFYFEDITSMCTIQNSTDDSLFGFILDTALTSWLKVCDLQITVAGSRNTISTLTTVEAQRVIAIYHEMRKNAKEQQIKGTTVVMNQNNESNDILAQIEKLASLRDKGILTEEEFTAKKISLLEKL